MKIHLDKLHTYKTPFPPDEEHIEQYAASIWAYGLLFPLNVKGRTVESNLQLLALRKFRAVRPEEFETRFPDGMIPVLPRELKIVRINSNRVDIGGTEITRADLKRALELLT